MKRHCIVEQSGKRKLAAILIADAVGYSRLMGRDEMGTVAAIQAAREIFHHEVEGHSGRIVNTPGDSILAEFPSVVEALSSAVEIQQKLADQNRDLPADQAMQFRIGINLGDIVEADDVIYGDGVNIAARLETLAEAGGITISGTAYDQVENKLPLAFEYAGEQQVKNIDRNVRVYNVHAQSSTAESAKQRNTGGSGFQFRKRVGIALASLVFIVAIVVVIINQFGEPGRSDSDFEDVPAASIAVLPFANMSGDPEQEYFADGITDTLITDLSKLRGLLVIARNSAFTYKNKSVDIKTVGRELGVRHVLEGSVQRAGDRIRLNAQLLDAQSGDHLWAERFDRPITDVFAVQDEITQQIVTELEVELVEGERARIWRHATDNPAAYDALMRGRQHFFQFTREEHAEAGHWFEKAIALDPEFALAYAFLSSKEWIDYRYGWGESPDESLKRAARLANRAIALDDQLAMGYVSLGYIYFIKNQDELAEIQFQKAFALNPNDALGVGVYGITLMYRERYAEALDHFSRMLKLSPVPNPGNLHFVGETYRLMGRHDEAIDTLYEVLILAPLYMGARLKLICAYVQADRLKEAERELVVLLENHPAFTVTEFETTWAPRSTSYRDPEEIGRMAGLLRTAGLPE
jgi:adenylate cyclase